MNASPGNKQNNLVYEAFGKGILDCGATWTVAGDIWLNEFIESLTTQDKEKVKEEKSQALFRFGDGGQCSMKKVTVPIKIFNKKYALQI